LGSGRDRHGADVDRGVPESGRGRVLAVLLGLGFTGALRGLGRADGGRQRPPLALLLLDCLYGALDRLLLPLDRGQGVLALLLQPSDLGLKSGGLLLALGAGDLLLGLRPLGGELGRFFSEVPVLLGRPNRLFLALDPSDRLPVADAGDLPLDLELLLLVPQQGDAGRVFLVVERLAVLLGLRPLLVLLADLAGQVDRPLIELQVLLRLAGGVELGLELGPALRVALGGDAGLGELVQPAAVFEVGLLRPEIGLPLRQFEVPLLGRPHVLEGLDLALKRRDLRVVTVLDVPGLVGEVALVRLGVTERAAESAQDTGDILADALHGAEVAVRLLEGRAGVVERQLPADVAERVDDRGQHGAERAEALGKATDPGLRDRLAAGIHCRERPLRRRRLADQERRDHAATASAACWITEPAAESMPPANSVTALYPAPNSSWPKLLRSASSDCMAPETPPVWKPANARWKAPSIGSSPRTTSCMVAFRSRPNCWTRSDWRKSANPTVSLLISWKTGSIEPPIRKLSESWIFEIAPVNVRLCASMSPPKLFCANW
jgi:hypothetical protein